MALKNIIVDPSTGIKASVVNDDKYNALVVATKPLKTFRSDIKFFESETYGRNLAQNAAPSGIPEYVYDGGDNTYWDVSLVSGDWADFKFESTAQAHTGTHSLESTRSEAGDRFRFTNTVILSVDGYSSLTGWLYVKNRWRDPEDGCQIILYNTISGTQVSQTHVHLDNYITAADVGVWQKFTIPINDFGTSSDFDSLDFTIVKGGDDPDFYLDDIQLETIVDSDIIEFDIEPDMQTWLYFNTLHIIYAAEYDSTLLNATMPKIPYDSFFNQPALDSGLIYQRIQNDEILLSYSIKQHSDIMMFGDSEVSGYGSDGTKSWVSIKIKSATDIILKSENNDHLRFVLSDDLSGLDFFQANIVAKVEDR